MSELVTPFYDDEGLPVLPSEIDAVLAPLLDGIPRGRKRATCFTPTYYHELLVRLAHKDPHLDGPIPLEHLPPLATKSELARVAIIDFLNGRFETATGSTEGLAITNPEGERVKPISTCDTAEFLFASMFDSMASAIEDPEEVGYTIDGQGWTIITDETSQPLAVKKRKGIPTSLSFVPLTVDGRRFPAGSLFRIDLHEDMSPEEHPPYKKRLSHSRRRVVTPSTNIATMRFLRLSTLAHQPEERASFYADGDHYPQDPSAQLSLDELADYARKSVVISEPVRFEVKD